MTSSLFSLRWGLALAQCWLLFINHYSRDITGALENEIEQGFGVSRAQYSAVNSIYFVPNLFVPLLAGMLAQRIGALKVVTLIIAASAAGHLVVGIGTSAESFLLFSLGRLLLGVCYETIDMMPLPLLNPLFQDNWAFLVGVFNGFLRLGSVLNFVASPWIYEHYGLAAAFWTSSALGLSGLAAVAAMWRFHRRMRFASAEGSGGVSLVEATQAAEANGTCRQDLQLPPPMPPKTGFSALPVQFWAFTVCGLCMYAAIVPFWFFGSRYLQDHFGCSLLFADSMMLLPEGMIALLSPLVGVLVDRSNWGLRLKLQVLSASLLGFPISYGLLMMANVPPLLSMVLLGSCWAWSNCLFWANSAKVMPENMLSLGSGIIGTSLNLGASVVPIIMSHMTDQGAFPRLFSSWLLSVILKKQDVTVCFYVKHSPERVLSYMLNR
ncbi:unnamed protein product [Polarella glacialis]|uniref:Lysosomal dipeptide transporter MFSD1 n=2 Tax=Polarella glacialis TaxID=89957 RepID=A0A813I942_POLGL|nr:unnamed protein product [Polarella glacialis]